MLATKKRPPRVEGDALPSLTDDEHYARVVERERELAEEVEGLETKLAELREALREARSRPEHGDAVEAALEGEERESEEEEAKRRLVQTHRRLETAREHRETLAKERRRVASALSKTLLTDDVKAKHRGLMKGMVAAGEELLRWVEAEADFRQELDGRGLAARRLILYQDSTVRNPVPIPRAQRLRAFLEAAEKLLNE